MHRRNVRNMAVTSWVLDSKQFVTELHDQGSTRDDAIEAVCQVFGLEPQSLQSNRKAKQVSHPRMLAMWLARKHTRAALSEIGDYFGRRSHSTVISAQKKINAWMADRTSLDIRQGPCDVEEAVRRIEQTLQAG